MQAKYSVYVKPTYSRFSFDLFRQPPFLRGTEAISQTFNRNNKVF